MNKTWIRLVGMLLIGPALIAVAGVLWAAGAPAAIVAVVLVAGWGALAVFTLWAAVLLLRRVPVPYCLLVAAAAIPVFLVSVVLHNVVSALLDAEEAVFFMLALVVSPAMLVGGLLAALIPRHPAGGETPKLAPR